MILLAILAVWKVSVMLTDYSGPLDVFEKLRDFVKPEWKVLNFDCVFCISTVVAFPFAFYFTHSWDFPLYWFGISGGAWIVNLIVEEKL